MTSASALRLWVSSSSLRHTNRLFFTEDWTWVVEVAGERRRRGHKRRSRERKKVWMKRIEVLRALKIGIIRLLAPEVSWSISALDMAEMEKFLQTEIGETETMKWNEMEISDYGVGMRNSETERGKKTRRPPMGINNLIQRESTLIGRLKSRPLLLWNKYQR